MPNFPVNLLESLFHALFNVPSLRAQMFELSHVLHPGFFLRLGPELLLESFGDKPAQGNAPFGSLGFCPPEQEIRDFKRRFRGPILPYLWEKPSRRIWRQGALILWQLRHD
ncbi:MAG: hypothetical protein WB562_00825 [Candidatus Sulfotelmatobacter sp.]